MRPNSGRWCRSNRPNAAIISGRTTPVTTWRDWLVILSLPGRRILLSAGRRGPVKLGLRSPQKNRLRCIFYARASWGAALPAPYPELLCEDRFAGEAGGGAEFFLDAQELVVLRDAVGARRRARLDLAGRSGYCQVRDERIFGLAAAVRNDRVESRFAPQFDCVDGLGNSSDLIQLDQDRVRNAFIDAARQTLGIRYEQIVANELNLLL